MDTNNGEFAPKVVTKNDLQNNIYKIIFIKMKFT